MKFYTRVKSGEKSIHSDFGGDLIQAVNPRFLNAGQDTDLGNFG